MYPKWECASMTIDRRVCPEPGACPLALVAPSAVATPPEQLVKKSLRFILVVVLQQGASGQFI
jgi:hypothetical protein